MHTLSRRDFLGTVGAAATGGAALRAASRTNAPAEPALALACSNYVRFLPIAAGDVRPAGVGLTWIRAARSEVLRRALEDTGIDGGETSMAQHVIRIDGGDRSFVAIPVFPLRNFTARDLYTRRERPLDRLSLAGARLGIYNWAASGAVWYRHLLRYLGHDTKKIAWTVGGVDGPSSVRIPDPPPPNVKAAPAGASLSDLLLRGEIDALFAPLPPARFNQTAGPIVRVFLDYQQVEERYFAETRCYPPQHVIVLRRTSWERDPSVAPRLIEAFNTAEARFEAAQREYPYNSPWLIGDVEAAVRVMGSDYHAHGLAKNRHAVDTFCRAAFDDGLTKRRVTVEEYFAEFLRA